MLDTDVVVAALRSDRGASRQLLLSALNRDFELLLSVPLILEYEAVLTRADHLAACGLSSAEIGRVLDDLAAVARPVRLAFRWRPRLFDPNDDMVLETAVNGNARAIVTFNQQDFGRAGKDFGFTVIPPAAALQEIRSSDETKQFRTAVTAFFAGGTAQSGRAGRRRSQPAHQRCRGRKSVCIAHGGVFPGARPTRRSRTETLRILSRAGKGNPPMKGDGLLPESESSRGRKGADKKRRAGKRERRKGTGTK